MLLEARFAVWYPFAPRRVPSQELAAAVQSGMGVLACAAADGALDATVDALLARRCQAARQGEPGEAGTRALLDEVLAATAAAVPGLQQLLLRPLCGLLQRQARPARARAAGQASADLSPLPRML